jgi:hypothetical protein
VLLGIVVTSLRKRDGLHQRGTGAALAQPLGLRGVGLSLPRRGPACNRDRVVAWAEQPKDISGAPRDATSPAGAKAKSATRNCSTAPPTAAACKIPSLFLIDASRNEFDRLPTARARLLNFAPAVKPDPEGPSDGMLPDERGTGAALALPLGLRGVGLTPPRRGPACNRDRVVVLPGRRIRPPVPADGLAGTSEM